MFAFIAPFVASGLASSLMVSPFAASLLVAVPVQVVSHKSNILNRIFSHNIVRSLVQQ